MFSVEFIEREVRKLRSISDSELHSQTQELRRLKLSIPRKFLGGPAMRFGRNRFYALSVEALRREFGVTLRRVQISGAIGLSKRNVIEMNTGEGKTYTGVPAIAWHALTGDGCHVLTSNPYLAERDADSLRPVFERLGLSVGCVLPGKDASERRTAYQKDVCYGTASELGFDYLRDCLERGPRWDQYQAEPAATTAIEPEPVQLHRGFNAVVVDEADSVLIDEASTPLIIAAETQVLPETERLYRWCDQVASELELGRDFLLEPRKLQAHLTDVGASKVILRRVPSELISQGSEEVLEQVERSVVARHLLKLARDYIVSDDEITLVSAATGRRLKGRKWQQGLHQAVEIKEGLTPSGDTKTTAAITIQEYFKLYKHISGMTGTASAAKRELSKFYRLGVRKIPPNVPCARRSIRPKVFRRWDEKVEAIICSTKKAVEEGRAVLIGTPSVETSESIANAFHSAQVSFQLLNAKQDAEEARVVAEAGQVGAVTIATNMAGRGTDIVLSDAVREAGGLLVIATEVHASKRIDQQLAGRSARQGDPGEFELIVSLEDEIWRTSGRNPQPLMRTGVRQFYRLQRSIEVQQRRERARAFKAGKRHRSRFLDAGFDPQLEVGG
ncbi:preprotein translocase, SecA subunit [Rhodopirellula baltica SWK14]|uniref:Preprotein translocase, SecA subunit n=2 Tax=Rhodopirellula baltica TaxID=265606 RepID=L7C9I1_RHOBT|nr:preprotein translocase, SecA subunit [Rhodopirellula baltica SWK14]